MPGLINEALIDSLDHNHPINRHPVVRMRVTLKMQSWGIHPHHTYIELARLLGYPDKDSMLESFNDEDASKCNALLGPHGYTIYKAMLARSSNGT